MAFNRKEYGEKWRQAHPDYMRNYMRQWNLTHKRVDDPIKKKARDVLNLAVHRGKVIKPTACQECAAVTKVQGHHNDYSKPLEVEWLCRLCHEKRHP